MGTGARHDLVKQEEQAFLGLPAIEVLRATGIRIEELTELSHHSLVQYRLPTTGELVPLPANRTVENRCRTAPGGQPRTRRGSQRGHLSRPRHQRRDSACRRL